MKNTMNSAKMLMSVTAVGLLGTGFVNAQDLTVTANTQASFGQRIMQTLTDAQKAVLEQAKSLFEAGKRDEAKTLLEANGIKAPLKDKGKQGKMKGNHGDKKAIEEAIIAGNFTNFQVVASTSPLKNINQATFNLLTPEFVAKKNAEEKIRAILKTAGVESPAPAAK